LPCRSAVTAPSAFLKRYDIVDESDLRLAAQRISRDVAAVPVFSHDAARGKVPLKSIDIIFSSTLLPAGMAELADALDLGSSAARRAGSSPVPGTRTVQGETWHGSRPLKAHSDQARINSESAADLQ
jgi:hypothetical protein